MRTQRNVFPQPVDMKAPTSAMKLVKECNIYSKNEKKMAEVMFLHGNRWEGIKSASQLFSFNGQ